MSDGTPEAFFRHTRRACGGRARFRRVLDPAALLARNEWYPCKPDIFEQAYEPVEESA